MEFKGFVSFYCNKAELDGKEIKIVDISDVLESCIKPAPRFLTKPEMDELKKQGQNALKEAREKSEKEWDEWSHNKFINSDAEEKYNKYAKISEDLYSEMVKVLKKYKWQFNGGIYQDRYVPVFECESEYFKLALSMRSWGGLVYQAKYELSHNDQKDGPDYEEMGYMDWYCGDAEKPKYPSKKYMLKELEFESLHFDKSII